MAELDYSERACPLPVVRKVVGDDGNYEASRIEVCGAPLHSYHHEGRYFLACGEVGSCGSTWKLECEGGHVLVVPDHEADDNFDAIPFDETQVIDALSRITPLT